MPISRQKWALCRSVGLATPFILALGAARAENIPGINDWRGAYFGPVFTITSIKQKFAPGTAAINRIRGTGKLAGIIAGYNTRYGNKVFGIEADITNKTVFKHSPYVLGSVRGRLGFASSGPMIYLTGGAAFAKPDRKSSNLTTGLALGAGIEQFAAKGISARLEYLHTYTPVSLSSKNKAVWLQNTNQIRVSVMIHFNE